MGTEPQFPHQRFEKFIKRAGKCWIWTGCQKGGYGYFTTGSRKDGTREKTPAHLFSYRFYEGPIPEGKVVFHTCSTPLCVAPNHLATGERSLVVARAVRSGRWTQGDASLFPDTKGEKNGRAKLSNEQRRAIIMQKGKVKVIILARRHNVTEQTIYRVQKGFDAPENSAQNE